MAVPLLPQVDFPSSDQRVESGKIIRMLRLGMRCFWHPVISAIADHATMASLGKTQGVGDHVAAAVGRTRVIEGLRQAELIRKGTPATGTRLFDVPKSNRRQTRKGFARRMAKGAHPVQAGSRTRRALLELGRRSSHQGGTSRQ